MTPPRKKNREIVELPTEPINAADTMEEAYGSYALYVIQNRAIPDYRDGMKNVYRRFAYQCELSNLKHTSPHWKLAKITGLVSGTWHPHGSTSVDGAAVTLSQAWSQRVPLVDIQGNNGSVEGSGAAASRYIEARLTEAAQLLNMSAFKKNAVDMRPNYDGKQEEPVTLPSIVPWGLINGVTEGIAVGIKTNPLPHNPVEMTKLVRLAVQDKLTLAQAQKIYKGPDFPTGGEFVNESQILQELESTRPSYDIRCRYDIEGTEIVIHEVPFGMTLESFLNKLGSTLVEKVPEVTDLRNMSELSSEPVKGIRIEISFKKNTTKARMEEIAAFLENSTPLVTNLKGINYFLTEHGPKELTIIDHAQMFAAYLEDHSVRTWQFELEKFQEQLAFRHGERAVLADIEALSEMLHTAQNKDELKSMIQAKFSTNEDVADYIASMPTHRLLKNDAPRIKALDGAIQSLESDISDRESWIGDGRTKKLMSLCDEAVKLFTKLGIGDRLTTVGAPQRKVSIEKFAQKAVSSLPRVVSVSTISPVMAAGTTAQTGDDWLTLSTTTDKYVGAVTRSGRLVVRQVIDLDKTEERVNRTIPDISSDDYFVSVFEIEDDESMSLVTFSAFGYMKGLRHGKIRPSVKTASYKKKAGFVSNVRNDDYIVGAISVPTDAVGEFTIVSPTRKTDQTVDAQKVIERNDSGKSNGARFFNTRNGQDAVSSVSFTEKKGKKK